MEKVKNEKLCVSVYELQDMLSVGRDTADKIGREAGALIHLGARKLFVVDKVKEYLNNNAEKL